MHRTALLDLQSLMRNKSYILIALHVYVASYISKLQLTNFMNSITVLLWERHTYVFSLTDRTKMHMFFFLI
jgi:hypothetical protein